MIPFQVYYQTWSDQWTQVPTNDELYNLKEGISVVNLSFANPLGTYKKGQLSWSGTGLEFTDGFASIQFAISHLKSKGVFVMLSVGGASYQYRSTAPYANYADMVALAQDLGCVGIDIDWEPPESDGGFARGQRFGPIIHGFKSNWPTGYLSAAVWSAGAWTPDGSDWKGVNLAGLQSNGQDLNWINIMAYDAGPPSSVDPITCFNSYRANYNGKIYLGIEPGPQAWGGYITTSDDVDKAIARVKQDQNAGIFVWSYQKDPGTTPSIDVILARISNANVASGQTNTGGSGSTTTVPTPAPPSTPATPQTFQIDGVKTTIVCHGTLTCPNCKSTLNF